MACCSIRVVTTGEAVAAVDPITAVSVVAATKAKRTISRDKRGTRTANRVANSRTGVAGRPDAGGPETELAEPQNRVTCLGWGNRREFGAVTETHGADQLQHQSL